MEKDFKSRLAESIEACGRWVSLWAPDIANEIEGRSRLSIDIDFDLTGNIVTPNISVTTDYVPKEAVDAMAIGR